MKWENEATLFWAVVDGGGPARALAPTQRCGTARPQPWDTPILTPGHCSGKQLTLLAGKDCAVMSTLVLHTTFSGPCPSQVSAWDQWQDFCWNC